VHEPVLVAEVVEALRPQRGGTFVDCTVGLGGHARALLDAGATTLVGLDRDAEALALAGAVLAPFGPRVTLVHADYRDLEAELDRLGVGEVDGIVADLGVSSMQLDAEGRGFSFRRDEPLDMRMDRSRGVTAAEWIAATDERAMADAIFAYGEERFARRIARRIARARDEAPIATTGQLAAVVRQAVPTRGYQRIDPATRTFQAIRIAVNRELDRLDAFLEAAAGRLAVGARLAIISFHSLEDRVVKHTFRAMVAAGRLALGLVTRRPVVPGDEEVGRNPRARSAKLRVMERLA